MAAISKKITNFLLILLILISLPASQLARVEIGNFAVTLMDSLVTALFLIFIFSRNKVKGRLLKPIIIFASILTLSFLVNVKNLNMQESIVSFSYILRWFIYAGIYFTFSNLEKKRVSKLLTMGGLLIVLGGFIQYFLYPDLRNLYYLGWDEHLYRMFTFTFFDPNFAGIFFVLYFLFILNKVIKTPKKMSMVILALTLIAIILTFSRSSYIALFFGSTVYLFLEKEIKKTLAIISFISLFLILTSVIFYFSPKSEGTNLIRIASGEARIESMKNAILIFKDNPIFGVGFNSYRYAQKKYGFIDESKMQVHSGAGTDNSFLFVLGTSGIIGFFAFLYLLLKIFNIKSPLIFSSVLAVILDSLFINSIFFPPIMLWLWILIGLNESRLH